MSIFESCSSCEKNGSGDHLGVDFGYISEAWRSLGATFSNFGGIDFCIYLFTPKTAHSCEKVAPGGPPKRNSAAWGLDLWRAGKTSHSEKSIAKQLGKHHFGKIAQTGAVRKGELLRGKVSQGRPHPLRHRRCIKNKIEPSAKLSVFCFLQSVGITLVKLYE